MKKLILLFVSFTLSLPLVSMKRNQQHDREGEAKKTKVDMSERDLERARKYLSNHPDALIDTCRRKNVAQVTQFVTAGAEVNIHDVGGCTPLHVALEGYSDCPMSTELSREIVTCLLYRGKADVNLQDNEGSTPLHKAAQQGAVEILRSLLRCGADSNEKNHGQKSPLHLALQIKGDGGERFEIIELLLEHNADPNTQDAFGATPLHYAAYFGLSDIITMLYYYGGRYTPDFKGMSPISYLFTKDLDIVGNGSEEPLVDLINQNGCKDFAYTLSTILYAFPEAIDFLAQAPEYITILEEMDRLLRRFAISDVDNYAETVFSIRRIFAIIDDEQERKKNIEDAGVFFRRRLLEYTSKNQPSIVHALRMRELTGKFLITEKNANENQIW